MKDNPAKEYLKRYRAALCRADALRMAINEAIERATDVSAKLRQVVVSGSGTSDRVAEDVARAIDMSAPLYEELKQARRVLDEVMEAIGAVRDEMQKTVLILRYVEGMGWPDIQDKIGYERTQTLVIHGRALWHVNKWLEDERKC